MSAPRTVATMWTSLRKPSGKSGRNGRSVRRQVRMPWSLVLPSRRKNEPGIFPAAYMRSSRSTVSGKKSTPSRTDLAAVAVTSTTVSPMRTVTAPSAWPASLPVSSVRVLSVRDTGPDVEMASAMGSPSWPGLTRRTSGSRALHGVRAAPVPSGDGRDAPRWRSPRASPLAADVHAGLGWFGCDPYPETANGDPEVAAGSPTQAQFLDDGPVALDVVLHDVVEQPPTPSHQHPQTSLRVEVLLVDLHVLGEVLDAIGQQRDLHLRRTGVAVVQTMLGDRVALGRQVGGFAVGHAEVILRLGIGPGPTVRCPNERAGATRSQRAADQRRSRRSSRSRLAGGCPDAATGR